MQVNSHFSQIAASFKFPLTLAVIYIHSFSVVSSVDDNGLFNVVREIFSFCVPRIAVPAFFCFSGYFFYRKWESVSVTYFRNIKKRIKSLLMPYVLWNVLSLIFLIATKDFTQTAFGEIFCSLFWSDVSEIEKWKWIGYEIPFHTPVNTAMWYIRDLFVICLISPLLLPLFNKRWSSVSMIILFLPYILLDTSKFPLLGYDNILFFTYGVYLTRNSIPVGLSKVIAYSCLCFLILFCLFRNESISVYLHHLYVTSFLLWIPNMRLSIQSKHLSDSSMFLYCSHIILIRLIAKPYHLIYSQFDLTDFGLSIFYLMFPIVITIAGWGWYYILKKNAPYILSSLTGNRY